MYYGNWIGKRDIFAVVADRSDLVRLPKPELKVLLHVEEAVPPTCTIDWGN